MSDRSLTGKRPGLRVIKNCKYFILVLAVANDNISCHSVYEKNIGAFVLSALGVKRGVPGSRATCGGVSAGIGIGPDNPCFIGPGRCVIKAFLCFGEHISLTNSVKSTGTLLLCTVRFDPYLHKTDTSPRSRTGAATGKISARENAKEI